MGVMIPIRCTSIDDALNKAKLYSHHQGYNAGPRHIYIIKRKDELWIDTSKNVSPGETLICSRFTRHHEPIVDKIVIPDLINSNGYFYDDGNIYAIFKSKKCIAYTEHVIMHFGTGYRDQLKRGNPNSRWISPFHLSDYVRFIIANYANKNGIDVHPGLRDCINKFK